MNFCRITSLGVSHSLRLRFLCSARAFWDPNFSERVGLPFCINLHLRDYRAFPGSPHPCSSFFSASCLSMSPHCCGWYFWRAGNVQLFLGHQLQLLFQSWWHLPWMSWSCWAGLHVFALPISILGEGSSPEAPGTPGHTPSKGNTPASSTHNFPPWAPSLTHFLVVKVTSPFIRLFLPIFSAYGCSSHG